MYDRSKFRVRKRKHSVRGVWVLLEMVEGGQEVWVGSLHLPVNELMGALPATDKPAFLLGDMNTHFTWGVQQGVAAPKNMHSRWSKLRQVTVERGFAQVAPRIEDAYTPTFVPRRAGASGTQIDGLFAARCHITPVQVEKESRQEIGTDHERVSARVMLRKGRGRDMPTKHQAGGPRRVSALPPHHSTAAGGEAHQTSFLGSGVQNQCCHQSIAERCETYQNGRGMEAIPDKPTQGERRVEGKKGGQSIAGLGHIQATVPEKEGVG